MKRILTSTIIVAAITISTLLVFGAAASAHHPVLEATPARPCGEQADWSATVTARADQDRTKEWRNQHKINDGSYTAESPWIADETPHVINLPAIGAGVASVTVTVRSDWRPNGPTNQTRSITINRPEAYPCQPQLRRHRHRQLPPRRLRLRRRHRRQQPRRHQRPRQLPHRRRRPPRTRQTPPAQRSSIPLRREPRPRRPPPIRRLPLAPTTTVVATTTPSTLTPPPSNTLPSTGAGAQTFAAIAAALLALGAAAILSARRPKIS